MIGTPVSLAVVDSTAVGLIEAFVAAYAPTAEARRGGITPPPGWTAALGEGEEWLRAELTALVAKPHGEQRRTPLEIFQEAMKFPTAALAAVGADPVQRDETAAAALPGDLYDLAPASSQDLDSAAWEAHLAWGVRRAAALRPAVMWVGGNLMDLARIETVVAAAGLRMSPAATVGSDTVEAERPVVLGLVDLQGASATSAIMTLAAAGIRVVAYGPHTDGEGLEAARRAGAAEAMARSRFFTRLPDLLPKRV